MPRILIVEDEPVHLNVLRAKLEREGYEVLSAADGEAGYELLKKERPDLVLLDIILPKLDGFEFLRRAGKERMGIPVIVVSNSGQPVEIDKALKLGAKDYLVKAEFNPDDVLEKVEKILGARPASTGGKLRILIIEDDKFLRDLISQKLKKEGFGILEAVDGESGLRIVAEEHPDLILLDLILPGLDGFEVLKRLKQNAGTASIPVIVLSNLGQKEDMDRARAAGAEDFMVKAHFTPGEIVSKIKAILKKKYF